MNDGYVLWLDDVRAPPLPNLRCESLLQLPRCWCISSEEAIRVIPVYGLPTFMDLDHDLGGEDTALVFLKWLANAHPSATIPYQVHSANPVGAANIVSFMESWKRSLR